MVYGVFGGCYSDWYVVGYFDNREDADKYCCATNADYYVEPLKDLRNEKDLSNIKLKYMHEILFDNQNNKWIMREEPDRYTCYINDELQCNAIYKPYNISWVKFVINIDHDDRKLAEKIAQDYLAELRSYGDGNIYNEYIDLMNKKFRKQFIEMEQLKREEELKERELAELKRLKEKYEK